MQKQKQMVENSNATVATPPSTLTNDMIIGLTNSLIRMRDIVTALANEKPVDIDKIQRSLDFIEAIECIYSIVTLVKVRIACSYVGTELTEPKPFETVRYNIRKLIFVNAVSSNLTLATIDFESIINSLDNLYAVSNEVNADNDKMSNAAVELIKATLAAMDGFLEYLRPKSQDDSQETVASNSVACYNNIASSVVCQILETVYKKYGASRWFNKWETEAKLCATNGSENTDLVAWHYVLHNSQDHLVILGPRKVLTPNAQYVISVYPDNCAFAQIVNEIVNQHSRASVSHLDDIQQPTATTAKETIAYEMIPEDKAYQVLKLMERMLDNGSIIFKREIVTCAQEPYHTNEKEREWHYRLAGNANDTVTIIGPSEYTGTYRVITAKDGFLANTVRSILGFKSIVK